jgi:hypothetical protein
MSDASSDVTQALARLKGLSFVMGRRDAAFDKGVKEAVELLEHARASLGSGPAPLAGALEPSIVEWIYSASDNAIRAAAAMTAEAVVPSRVEVLSGALLSIREWAARQLPPERLPALPESGIEPMQLR